MLRKLLLMLLVLGSVVWGMASAQEEEPTPPEIRFVQIFYSEADVYLDGELIYPNLAFTVATDFLPLEAGEHTVQIAKAGEVDNIGTTLEFEAGQQYTVLTMGEFEVDNPTLVVLNETATFADYDPLGNSAIIVQNVPQAIPVDVWFLDELKIENLTFGTYGTASAPLGEFIAQAVMVGDRASVVFESHYFAVPNTVSLAYLSGSFPDGINRTFFTTTPVNTLDYLTAHTALENSSLTTFLELLELAGLTEMFAGETQYTIFAPTNEAFAALPDGTLDTLKNDPALLAELLSYHVVEGRFGPYELTNTATLSSVQGAALTVLFEPPTAPIVNGHATGLQHRTRNGVIYLVDTVLTPPNIE